MDRNRRLLLIDDNAPLRSLYHLVLNADGWDVTEAADGWTGFDLAETLQPDLIIQDLLLPDTDGRTLLDDLRSLPGGARRPILVVSGWRSQLDRIRREHLPFVACAEKPMPLGNLRRLVRDCAENPGGL